MSKKKKKILDKHESGSKIPRRTQLAEHWDKKSSPSSSVTATESLAQPWGWTQCTSHLWWG